MLTCPCLNTAAKPHAREVGERGKPLWCHGGSEPGSSARWLNALAVLFPTVMLSPVSRRWPRFLLCTGRSSLQEKRKPSTLVIVSPTFTSSDVHNANGYYHSQMRALVLIVIFEFLSHWTAKKNVIKVKIQSNYFITVEIFT